MKAFTSINSICRIAKVLLPALFLLNTVICSSKQITKVQSLSIAKQFYSEQKNSTVFRVKSTTEPEFRLDYICTDTPKALNGLALAPSASDSTAYYYVYNIGNKQGFVIVSGDDRTKPILGYSDNGAFFTGNIPEHVQAFMDNYKNQIKAIMQRNETGTMQKVMRITQSDSAVAPLITTKWGQDTPYNSLLPFNAPTGCVATAMAQVMNYYKWPVQGTSSHMYYTNNTNISVNFGSTTYDWTNMKNIYSTTDDANSLSSKAVATLMYHCGVSVDMKYTATSSGAPSQNISTAFINYFGYDNNLKYIDYTSNPNLWKNQIKQEIGSRRPVIIHGYNGTLGHAYIADGYDTYNFIHFNWGWDGYYNGYFEIDPIDGSTFYLPVRIIVGIQKPVITTNTSLIYKGFGGLTFNTSTPRTKAINATIEISEENKRNFNGDIGLAFYRNEKLYSIIDSSSSTIATSTILTKNISFTISDTLSIGTYRLVPLFKSMTDTTWSEIKYKRVDIFDPRTNQNIEFVISNSDLIIYYNSKTMNCKKNEFKTNFSFDDCSNVQRLVVSGQVDQFDLLYMASAKSIKTINLENANIINTEIDASELAYGGKPSNFFDYYINLSSKWKNFVDAFWHGTKYMKGSPIWADFGRGYFYCNLSGLYYDSNRDLYFTIQEPMDTDPTKTQINVQIIGDQGSITIGEKGLMADVFSGSTIESITLPNNLKYVAPMAFANCKNLTNISLPDSICLIGDSLFYNCTSLRSIKFPKKINNIWRQGLSSLILLTVILPDSVTSLEVAKCVGPVKNITIPTTATTIADGAFSNCTALTSITIPTSVTSIGRSAFYGCTALTSITIPSSVTSIGSSAFYRYKNQGLKVIKVLNPVPINLTTAGVFSSLDLKSCILQVPIGSINAYKTANQWKDFKYIFEGEYNPTKTINVTAGQLLQSLQPIEFIMTTNLTVKGSMDTRDFKVLKDSMIYLSNLDLSEVDIVAYAESDVSGYVKKNYPEKTIPEYSFSGLTILTSIILPSSITSIGNNAFKGCSGLKSINIPTSVASIEYNAFYGCTGLTSIKIPESVTSIEEYTFDGCTGLTTINIPSSVTSFGKYAFGSCIGLTSINIPSSVNSIGSGAFNNCTALTSITIPKSVTSIEYNTFNGCKGLTTINIPESVTSIGEYSFYGCKGLTTINIPESVTSIGEYSFYGCKGLTTIEIPSSVTSIAKYAFMDCIGLFVVKTGNLNYSSLDGVLYNKTKTQLNQCPISRIGGFNIPSTVTSIGFGAFSGCSGLTFIDIPSSVTSIGEYAFYGCTGLTSINIPSLVTSIERGAFGECTSLTSIKIPDGVTSIGFYSFSNCKVLTTINIPSTTTTIGPNAFERCISLTSFKIPDSVTSIGFSAFEYCSSLNSVYIPLSITSIGNGAFEGCSSLKSIYAYSKIPVDISMNLRIFGYVNIYTCNLYVPFGSKAAYQAAAQWKDFTNIIELDALAVNNPKETENKIFYNTANRSLQINGLDKPVFVSIYDITGKLHYNGFVSGSDQLQVGVLSKGVYLVKTVIDNKNYSNKIMVY